MFRPVIQDKLGHLLGLVETLRADYVGLCFQHENGVDHCENVCGVQLLLAHRGNEQETWQACCQKDLPMVQPLQMRDFDRRPVPGKNDSLLLSHTNTQSCR